MFIDDNSIRTIADTRTRTYTFREAIWTALGDAPFHSTSLRPRFCTSRLDPYNSGLGAHSSDVSIRLSTMARGNAAYDERVPRLCTTAPRCDSARVGMPVEPGLLVWAKMSKAILCVRSSYGQPALDSSTFIPMYAFGYILPERPVRTAIHIYQRFPFLLHRRQIRTSIFPSEEHTSSVDK